LTLAAISSPHYGRLFWLALGTFAIGTEGFMIAGLLPGIASDLSVSIETAGQLVTVFALAYAVSSPVLTTFTGHLDRRKVLIVSMVAFTLANVVAFEAKDYWTLMGARVLLAFAAGLYVPNANALAAALVPHERRGAALAIVNGGTTIALVFGVPLGAIIGTQLGWRMTFGGVAILSVIATIGLLTGLSHDIGHHMAVVTLRKRIAVAGRPPVLLVMLVTMLWATGAFTIYTYLAPYLTSAIGIGGANISLVLFMWGNRGGDRHLRRRHPMRQDRHWSDGRHDPPDPSHHLRQFVGERMVPDAGNGGHPRPHRDSGLGRNRLGFLPSTVGASDRDCGPRSRAGGALAKCVLRQLWPIPWRLAWFLHSGKGVRHRSRLGGRGL
jgi:hypothetical protein